MLREINVEITLDGELEKLSDPISEFPFKTFAKERHELGWFPYRTSMPPSSLYKPLKNGVFEVHDILIEALSPDLVLTGGMGIEDCGACQGGISLFEAKINDHPIVGKLLRWSET